MKRIKLSLVVAVIGATILFGYNNFVRPFDITKAGAPLVSQCIINELGTNAEIFDSANTILKYSFDDCTKKCNEVSATNSKIECSHLFYAYLGSNVPDPNQSYDKLNPTNGSCLVGWDYSDNDKACHLDIIGFMGLPSASVANGDPAYSGPEITRVPFSNKYLLNSYANIKGECQVVGIGGNAAGASIKTAESNFSSCENTCENNHFPRVCAFTFHNDRFSIKDFLSKNAACLVEEDGTAANLSNILRSDRSECEVECNRSRPQKVSKCQWGTDILKLNTVLWGPQDNTPFNANTVGVNYEFAGQCYNWTTIDCNGTFATNLGMCKPGLRYSLDFKSAACPPPGPINNVVWGPQSNTPFNAGTLATSFKAGDLCYSWTTKECNGTFQTNKGMCGPNLRYSTDFKSFACPQVNDVVWGPQSNTPFNAGTSQTSFKFADQCYSWTTKECNGTFKTNKDMCQPGLKYSTDFKSFSCNQVNGVVWGPQDNTPFNAGTSESSYKFGDQCYSWTTKECNGTFPTNLGQCKPGLKYSTDLKTVSCQMTGLTWGPTVNTPFNAGNIGVNFRAGNQCFNWTTIDCNGTFDTNRGKCEPGKKYSKDYSGSACPTVIPNYVTNVVWGPQHNTPFNAGTSATNYKLNGQCYSWTTTDCNGSYKTNRGQCRPQLIYSTDFKQKACAVDDVKWGPQDNTPFNAGTSATNFKFAGSCYAWTTKSCVGTFDTNLGQCKPGLRYSTDYRSVACK